MQADWEIIFYLIWMNSMIFHDKIKSYPFRLPEHHVMKK